MGHKFVNEMEDKVPIIPFFQSPSLTETSSWENPVNDLKPPKQSLFMVSRNSFSHLKSNLGTPSFDLKADPNSISEPDNGQLVAVIAHLRPPLLQFIGAKTFSTSMPHLKALTAA